MTASASFKLYVNPDFRSGPYESKHPISTQGCRRIFRPRCGHPVQAREFSIFFRFCYFSVQPENAKSEFLPWEATALDNQRVLAKKELRLLMGLMLPANPPPVWSRKLDQYVSACLWVDDVSQQQSLRVYGSPQRLQMSAVAF